jgi:hypothetical protein
MWVSPLDLLIKNFLAAKRQSEMPRRLHFLGFGARIRKSARNPHLLCSGY